MAIIERAWKKHHELQKKKVGEIEALSIDEYLAGKVIKDICSSPLKPAAQRRAAADALVRAAERRRWALIG